MAPPDPAQTPDQLTRPAREEPGGGLWEKLVLRLAGPLTRRLLAQERAAETQAQSQAALARSVAAQLRQLDALHAAQDQASAERGELSMRQDDDAREFSSRLGQFAAALEQLSQRQADDTREFGSLLRAHETAQQSLHRQQAETAQLLDAHRLRQAEALRLHAEKVEQAQLALSAAQRETRSVIEAGRASLDERSLRMEQGLARITGDLAAAAAGLRQLGARMEAEARRREFPAGEDFNYTAFEDIFRGAESVIRERQMAYLPLLKEHAPIIDLGCGRGELVELLNQAGIAARGIESNARQAARCRAKGLPVDVRDLRGWLAGAGEGVAGGITLLQVAEHLPTDEIMPVIRNIHRVLPPGGIALIETVNPHCAAAMEWFYIDPTHRRPVYPEMLKFLLSEAGFRAIGISYQSPAPGSPAERPPDSAIGMDYAIWGYKA